MAEKRPRAEESDEVLARRCVGGDPDAFAALVDRHKHGVHGLVRRMVGESDAEDLTQDVFVRVYRALPAFRGASAFRTWMYKVARNVCLSELRKRGSRAVHLSLEEEGEERLHGLFPESAEGLEKVIEREDLGRRVRALVERLPVPHRTALTLFYLNQLKYEEVAEVMEVPLGTVKTLIHRGRLRLRALVLAEMGTAGFPDGPAARAGV